MAGQLLTKPAKQLENRTNITFDQNINAINNKCIINEMKFSVEDKSISDTHLLSKVRVLQFECIT